MPSSSSLRRRLRGAAGGPAGPASRRGAPRRVWRSRPARRPWPAPTAGRGHRSPGSRARRPRAARERGSSPRGARRAPPRRTPTTGASLARHVPRQIEVCALEAGDHAALAAHRARPLDVARRGLAHVDVPDASLPASAGDAPHRGTPRPLDAPRGRRLRHLARERAPATSGDRDREIARGGAVPYVGAPGLHARHPTTPHASCPRELRGRQPPRQEGLNSDDAPLPRQVAAAHPPTYASGGWVTRYPRCEAIRPRKEPARPARPPADRTERDPRTLCTSDDP